MRRRMWIVPLVLLVLGLVGYQVSISLTGKHEPNGPIAPIGPEARSEPAPTQAASAPATLATESPRPVSDFEGLKAQFPFMPPPILIHVKEAKLEGLVAALNGDMGTNMLAVGASQAMPLFTVDVTGKTFGEAIAAIDEQNPIFLMPGIRLTIRQGQPALPHTHYSYHGPFLMAAQMYMENKATAPQYALSFTFVCDPRLKIVDTAFKFTITPDDAGLEWLRTDSGVNMLAERTARQDPNGRAVRLFLKRPINPKDPANPANAGKIIPHVTVESDIRVQVTTEILDIENVDQKQKQEFTVGGATVQVNELQVIENRLFVDMTAKMDDPNQAVVMKIVDAAGRIFYSRNINAFNPVLGKLGDGITPPATPPLTLHLEAPGKITTSHVTFDFHDLPIPH